MTRKPTPVATTPAPAAAERPVVESTLEEIRERSLRARSDAARTINELEAWRDEIDATIAFLRAQGGGRRA